MKKLSLAILAFSGLFAASAVFAAAPTPSDQPVVNQVQAIATSSQAAQPTSAAWMMGQPARPAGGLVGRGGAGGYGMMRTGRPMMTNGNRTSPAVGRYHSRGMMIVGLVVSSITLLLVWAFLISAIMTLCQWRKLMKAQSNHK